MDGVYRIARRRAPPAPGAPAARLVGRDRGLAVPSVAVASAGETRYCEPP